MPITDPRQFKDKTADWYEVFIAARKKKFPPELVRGLLAEYENDPAGETTRHSPLLHQLVVFVRNVPIDGKVFVHAKKPYSDYRIAQMRGRGRDPDLDSSISFSTELDAVREVFRRRLVLLGLGQ